AGGTAGATAGGQAAAAVATAGDESPGGGVGVTGRPPGTVTEAGRQDPPAWDPLGAAPFAWDLPEPRPPKDAAPPPRRRRSRITMATLGLALVAGGITAAIALPLAGVGGVRLVLGVMLAVVGLGLLVGAIRHSGRALIVVAIPLLLLGYGVTKAPMGGRWMGAGDLRVAPTTLAQLAPSYERTFGSVTLDLRRLDPSGSPTGTLAPPAAAPTAPPPGQPVRTVVNLEVGDITVLLPPNLDVSVHCKAEFGDVNCLGQHGESDGPTQETTVSDPGADGVRSGRPLELELLVRTGDVGVRRG
ncbi:MAG: hypothetical protein J2P19_31885, partial [Pseudonocardia sp.]|nr:hypothetical protein [Pseudonocardia sp.]